MLSVSKLNQGITFCASNNHKNSRVVDNNDIKYLTPDGVVKRPQTSVKKGFFSTIFNAKAYDPIKARVRALAKKSIL